MTTNRMDAKHVARYLGALSIEERVQIIECLLEAGDEGRDMLDIAARIELGVAAVNKQLESLAGLEMVFMKSVNNNKVYLANAKLLNDLFDHMVQHYGSGFHATTEGAGNELVAIGQAQS